MRHRLSGNETAGTSGRRAAAAGWEAWTTPTSPSYFLVDPAIVRFVPELLQDLDALGGDPEHAPALRAFVEKERRECELLESALECATWMLQRA